MQLELIETFLDLCDTKSFNRTADKLGVTQSTVSGRVRARIDVCLETVRPARLSDLGPAVGPLDGVVVLDLGLPGLDGIEVCRQLRTFTDCYVIVVTARKDEIDTLIGLSVGADDYVTKPFILEEVVLRLRALLRRTGVSSETGGAKIVVGDLVLDEDSHEVTRGGEQISLTATEFELLRFMMRNSKRVLSKAQILDRVWDYDFGGRSNIVELYISYLRKKIDSGREPMIHTMRGAGYVLKPAR